MSKIAFKLLQTSKTSEEKQIYVVHRHKESDFQRSVGLSVHPKYFDTKTGKVSKLTQAPEMNKAIQALVSDIETAARNCFGKGIEPVKNAIQAEYEAIVAERKLHTELAPQAVHILDSWLDILRAQLADLEAQVAEKKKEIEAEELAQGVYKHMLLSTYIDNYVKDRKDTLAKNSIRLFPNVRDWVNKFNPTWRIDDVNKQTLTDFQNYLIQAGLKSVTIADIVTKLKSVVRYFAFDLKLDLASFNDFKLGFKKKRNQNVVYLNKEQLEDLLQLDVTSKADTMCRDVFCLMSLTGLRFSDAWLTPEQVKPTVIKLSTEKTDTELEIPLNREARVVLERLLSRSDYKPQHQQHFNKRIKRLCQQLGSFYEAGLPIKESVKSYKGKNKADTTEYVNKFDLVTCHTGRRTFINLSLAKGISPATIASIVGHEGTELIMKTYSNKKVGIEKIATLLDEDE